RMVMPSRGMPAASRRRSTGGSVLRLGAGRVMSQTEIAALRFPRASSVSDGVPIGSSSAASSADCQSSSGVAERASSKRYLNPSGRSATRPLLPKASLTCINAIVLWREMLRILAIHAHPDDCEILAGGTLALLAGMGHHITIATMTPGDCGSSTLGPEEI